MARKRARLHFDAREMAPKQRLKLKGSKFLFEKIEVSPDMKTSPHSLHGALQGCVDRRDRREADRGASESISARRRGAARGASFRLVGSSATASMWCRWSGVNAPESSNESAGEKAASLRCNRSRRLAVRTRACSKKADSSRSSCARDAARSEVRTRTFMRHRAPRQTHWRTRAQFSRRALRGGVGEFPRSTAPDAQAKAAPASSDERDCGGSGIGRRNGGLRILVARDGRRDSRRRRRRPPWRASGREQR